MSAAPFHETEVETGWFAGELAGEVGDPGFRCWVARDGDRVVGFAYGLPTPEVPAEGCYGLLRDAVGQAAGGNGWRASSRSSGSPSPRSGGAGAWAGNCWSGCSPAPALSGPGWSPTTWRPRPAPSTAPSDSGSWAAAPSARTTSRGSSSAPTSRRPARSSTHRPACSPAPGQSAIDPPGSRQPTRRHRVPRWGRLPRLRNEGAALSTGRVAAKGRAALSSGGSRKCRRRPGRRRRTW
jgi:hypothetical protein